MKHEWDYVQGGKTSVKIHNAPGIKHKKLIFKYRWQFLIQHWMGQ